MGDLPVRVVCRQVSGHVVVDALGRVGKRLLVPGGPQTVHSLLSFFGLPVDEAYGVHGRTFSRGLDCGSVPGLSACSEGWMWGLNPAVATGLSSLIRMAQELPGLTPTKHVDSAR